MTNANETQSQSTPPPPTVSVPLKSTTAASLEHNDRSYVPPLHIPRYRPSSVRGVLNGVVAPPAAPYGQPPETPEAVKKPAASTTTTTTLFSAPSSSSEPHYTTLLRAARPQPRDSDLASNISSRAINLPTPPPPTPAPKPGPAFQNWAFILRNRVPRLVPSRNAAREVGRKGHFAEDFGFPSWEGEWRGHEEDLRRHGRAGEGEVELEVVVEELGREEHDGEGERKPWWKPCAWKT